MREAAKHFELRFCDHIITIKVRDGLSGQSACYVDTDRCRGMEYLF